MQLEGVGREGEVEVDVTVPTFSEPKGLFRRRSTYLRPYDRSL